LGLAYDTPTFPSLDGTRITGIFFKSQTQPVKGTVVHLHGNGANITLQWGFSAWLVRQGFNVFVLDYRGYGASQGKPSERGAVEDAIAALRYLRGRPDVDAARLVVLGQSLGGAVAVAAVAAAPEGVKALAVESAFSSYRAIVREKLGEFWLTWPLQWPLSLLISDRYRPATQARYLPAIPLLVIHGTDDATVSYREGLRLYQAARQPKQLWTIAGGDHVQAFTIFRAQYRAPLVSFFEAALAR
jgi:fermentation-respiration switch protein FrsA (DUF1100 family)